MKSINCVSKNYVMNDLEGLFVDADLLSVEIPVICQLSANEFCRSKILHHFSAGS